MLLRLAAVLAVAAALVEISGADAAVRPVAGSPPQGLRAFLLRADEAPSRTYSRTPSFAWKPVPGAIRYEFQLSTANEFREGAVVYTASDLASPTASVPLTLPWITGSPYSLYARVRAVMRSTITPWSRPFGFNMRWPSVPTPLPGSPGLLRWSPVDGAAAYQVWLIDVPKMATVYTNVLDQREFYTFHQASSWIGTVRWRVRALRYDDGTRVNRLPAVTYGPWSPVYSSSNPAFAAGPLQPLRTVSDVVATGSSASEAHRLMPGFVFTGNQTLDGKTAELYRIYVFTDRDCLNTVFTSAIVGSPAYAPRPFGPLALPRTAAAVSTARGTYLQDGGEGATFSLDGRSVKASEAEPAAAPTTGLPKDGASATSGGSGSSGESGGSGSSSGQHAFVEVRGELGAPVDLWDTDWPRGAYYWTVVGVELAAPVAFSTTTAGAASAGDKALVLANAAGVTAGDSLTVGTGAGSETVTVTQINGATVTVAAALQFGHAPGEPVVRSAATMAYRDLELPQEVCAAGRVLRFGKTSEPALTSAGSPFASGLSPVGRLTSASRTSVRFYGHPLVAWAPALGASVYEVQWSKTRYPFRSELDTRTQTRGLMTTSTSAVLPLEPGTWWYRVRGINYQLPSGAQQMSWSPAVRLVVARPTFRVVR